MLRWVATLGICERGTHGKPSAASVPGAMVNNSVFATSATGIQTYNSKMRLCTAHRTRRRRTEDEGERPDAVADEDVDEARAGPALVARDAVLVEREREEHALECDRREAAQTGGA